MEIRKIDTWSTWHRLATGLHLTASGDGVDECGGQECGLTVSMAAEEEVGVEKCDSDDIDEVEDGGESVRVSLFLGLVRVGRRSLWAVFYVFLSPQE
jgi:hypothetical protein